MFREAFHPGIHRRGGGGRRRSGGEGEEGQKEEERRKWRKSRRAFELKSSSRKAFLKEECYGEYG